MPRQQAPSAQPATACATRRPHPHPGGDPPTHHPPSAYPRKCRAGHTHRANFVPGCDRTRMTRVAQDILELTPEQREIQAVCGEQRRRWSEPIAGERPPLTGLATTEPGAGSDAASMQTTAARVDGGYVLRGQKSWLSNGGVSDYYVVFATVAPGTRSKGITAFIVEKGDAGITFGAPMKKMGQRAIVNAELFLEDTFLPEDRRIGNEGQGFYGLMHTFDASRVTLGASAVGLARAALEYAVEYAKTRVQFGKPIAEHQAVAFRLADMAVKVDAARLLVWRAARKLDLGEAVPKEAAMAKLFASETAMWCTWAAVQTLGGWGYSREYPVEKWMRDAKLEEIEEGTSDIQRLIISRRLLQS